MTAFVMAEASSFAEASEDPPAVRLEDKPDERSAFADVSEDKPEVTPRWESVEAGIADGKALLEQGDVAGAVALWEQVSEAFPESVAFQGPGWALVRAERHTEAINWVLSGLKRFPNDMQMMIVLGWATHGLRRFDEALRLWESIRRDHPLEWQGYLGAGATLRDAGCFEEAEAVLLEACERLGDSRVCQADLARTAMGRRDWESAAARWERVLAEEPGNLEAYLGGARALRELARFSDSDALLEEALDNFPNNSKPYIDLAMNKFFQRQLEDCSSLMAEARTRFPDELEPHLWGGICLRELGKLDGAEAVFRVGVHRWPDHAHMAIVFARLAQTRGDLFEAVERWRAGRDRFPDRVEFRVGLVSALRSLGSVTDAKRVLTEACGDFPSDKDLQTMWAELEAERKGPDSFQQGILRRPELTLDRTT